MTLTSQQKQIALVAITTVNATDHRLRLLGHCYRRTFKETQQLTVKIGIEASGESFVGNFNMDRPSRSYQESGAILTLDVDPHEAGARMILPTGPESEISRYPIAIIVFKHDTREEIKTFIASRGDSFITFKVILW